MTLSLENLRSDATGVTPPEMAVESPKKVVGHVADPKSMVPSREGVWDVPVRAIVASDKLNGAAPTDDDTIAKVLPPAFLTIKFKGADPRVGIVEPSDVCVPSLKGKYCLILAEGMAETLLKVAFLPQLYRPVAAS